MAKVAYNACYGGFSLSREAVLRGREISGNPKWNDVCIKGDVYDDGQACKFDFGHLDDSISRHDPILIQVIEELGEKASGSCALLKIEDVGTSPYRITYYDGYETVETTADTYDWINPNID